MLWGLGILFAFVSSIGLTSIFGDPTQSVDFLLPTLMVVFESSVELAMLALAAIGFVVAKVVDALTAMIVRQRGQADAEGEGNWKPRLPWRRAALAAGPAAQDGKGQI